MTAYYKNLKESEVKLMNATIERIKHIEAVPEDHNLIVNEALDLKQFASDNSLLEAFALAYQLGFANGRTFEAEQRK